MASSVQLSAVGVAVALCGYYFSPSIFAVKVKHSDDVLRHNSLQKKVARKSNARKEAAKKADSAEEAAKKAEEAAKKAEELPELESGTESDMSQILEQARDEKPSSMVDGVASAAVETDRTLATQTANVQMGTQDANAQQTGSALNEGGEKLPQLASVKTVAKSTSAFQPKTLSSTAKKNLQHPVYGGNDPVFDDDEFDDPPERVASPPRYTVDNPGDTRALEAFFAQRPELAKAEEAGREAYQEKKTKQEAFERARQAWKEKKIEEHKQMKKKQREEEEAACNTTWWNTEVEPNKAGAGDWNLGRGIEVEDRDLCKACYHTATLCVPISCYHTCRSILDQWQYGRCGWDYDRESDRSKIKTEEGCVLPEDWEWKFRGLCGDMIGTDYRQSNYGITGYGNSKTDTCRRCYTAATACINQGCGTKCKSLFSFSM